jgi:hypothetical protein
MSRHQPEQGADGPDAAVTYRVPLRSLDSDHTTSRYLKVWGPRDLQNQLDDLRVEMAGYSLGTPRIVEEEAA